MLIYYIVMLFLSIIPGGRSVVKMTDMTKGPLGFDFMSWTTQYTGRLLDDCVLMVSNKLDNCFIIYRNAMSDASFSDNGKIRVRVEGAAKELSADAISII